MIKEKLLGLPMTIAKLRLRIIELENELLNKEGEKDKWEILQLDEIARATDEDGKVIFTNDTKRKAELERRKENDLEYRKTVKLIEHLKYNITVENIELDKLYNEQKNLRAICRLGSDE